MADLRATQSEQRLRGLLDAGRFLVSELDLEGVLARLLDVARELTGARYAAIGVLDERKQELERFVTAGVDEATRQVIGELPRGRGILGELIRKPAPLRLADIAEHPHSYGLPPGHPPMHTFLGAPVVVGGEPWGNIYLTEKTGGELFDEADEETLVVLAEWAGIAITNARLYERATRGRSELEAAVRRTEATMSITRALGGETDLDRILELIVKRGRALVDARFVAILLQEGEELDVAASAGAPTDASIRGHRVPIAGTVTGSVLSSGRGARFTARDTQLHFPLRNLLDASSALLVPLVYRGRPLGVLAAFDREGGSLDFRAEDEYVLEAFAAAAATAVATAQSVQSDALRRAIEAAEEERRRWARELHDQTLQDLGATKLVLDTARALPPEAQAVVERVSDQLEGSIQGLQTLITELRPAALDELGLVPAVEALAERMAELGGFRARAEVSLAGQEGGPSRLAAEIEAAAYRLTQEALNNVLKHAAAESVAVSVTEHDSVLEIEVSDDGRGFDPQRGDGGFGLVGMRERVELLDGSLELESEPGRGTVVRARLPATRRDRRQLRSA